VVVPHIGDQAYWAYRLRRLGVAPQPIALDRLDAKSLAEAVLSGAADPRLRERTYARGRDRRGRRDGRRT
jgi:UDP:flavonoid glycosyltransferase YjiC (YdhE family)